MLSPRAPADVPEASPHQAEPRPGGGWRSHLRAPLVPSRQAPVSIWGRVLVVAGAAAFATWYGLTACWAFDRFDTFTFDAGIYDQGLWLMSRFHSPFISLIGRHLFGDHASFILVFLVPLYWLGASMKVLLVLQAVVLALAAWPVFLIARDLLASERVAAVLATVFLLQPALAWTAREQFHPDAFEVPLLLFALWFMLRRRWVGFFMFVGLALLVKEDVALVTLLLGVYVAVRYSRKVGLATVAGSVLYFVIAVYGVMRHFNGVGILNAWRIPFGGAGGLATTLLTDPLRVADYLAAGGRLWYLWQLLAPLALLPLLAPGVLAVAAGPILVNLLSTFWYQHSIEYHYATQVLPFLALAAILGLSRLRRPGLRPAVAALVVGAAIASTVTWEPGLVIHYYGGYRAAPDPAAVQAALDLVPPDAVVSSYYRYTTHFDHRVAVYDLPNPFRDSYWGIDIGWGKRLPEADSVEYVVVPTHALSSEMDKSLLQELRADFETIHDSGGVLVLERRDS
jgi:uncharacterized membrane protein